MEELKVLELFSGIGGMHFALKKSLMPGEIFGSIDINENANSTYQHNFPETKCMNKNIQKLNIKDFQSVNCIFMSPPCQPFTRNGKFKDINDRRSDAFLSVCNIIEKKQLPLLSYILMENVMGFEKSQMRTIFIDALKAAGFYHQEFVVSPHQIGVPNTRHRYYCIARKTEPFKFSSTDILTSLPDLTPSGVPEISSFTDDGDHQSCLLLNDVLEKRFQVLDICTKDSTNSMCFTKSYSRYLEGTGSVFCPMTRAEFKEKIEEIEQVKDKMDLKKALKLRFFTPKEVARLMSFPASFTFPDSINDKQRYKLLGNSINVAVVGELIKLMYLRW